MNAALKYDYVKGHGLSVHPGWTVSLGRRAAGVQNGRIHPSPEGDVTNRIGRQCQGSVHCLLS